MKHIPGAIAATLLLLACGQTSSPTADPLVQGTRLTSPVTCSVRVPPGTRWDDDVRAASPGAVICLTPGATYPGSGWLETRNGTATQPITVVSVGTDGTWCPQRARLNTLEGQDAILRIGRSQHLVFDCLEFDGSGFAAGTAADVIHVDSVDWRPGMPTTQPHSRSIVFRNIYAHHAGDEGDVLKVNHSVDITVERSELAFPGRRPGCPSGNCWQECLDFVGVESSTIQDNWLRNAGNMLGYIKGGSRDIILRRNVFSQQGASGYTPIDPAVGIGAYTSASSMINGGTHEAINIRFHDNVIMHARAGALGVYDAKDAYVANNLFLDNDGAVVEFRAGNGSAARSENVQFINNLFVDTRGQLPAPYRHSSHGLTGWVHRSNTYWNAGAAIPAAQVPTGSTTPLNASTETGFSSDTPGVAAPAASASLATVIATTRPAAGSTAYDSGEDVSALPFGVTTDIEGNTRSGTFDRGPHSGARSGGGGNPGGGTVQDSPILPVIDSTRKATLRALLAEGSAVGNRSNVFAKLGDSITESASFLADVGCGDTTYGTAAGTTSAELRPTVDAFSAQSVPGDGSWCSRPNSFNRQSMAAQAGWTVSDVLATGGVSCAAPNNTPAKCELATLKPAFAIIMLGTNDLQEVNDVAAFKTQLTTLVRQVIQAKVIPVLSTIPPRLDSTTYGARVAAYNQAILEVATSTDSELQGRVLLLNYWRALQGADMLNQGLDADGIHPSTYSGSKAADFTAAGLRHGYNQRNLTWVQTLEKAKRIVVDNGTPDASSGGTAVTSVTFSVAPSPGTVGTQATITASSSGSSAPRYQFKVTPPGGTATTVCAYSASTTCAFTPTVSGTHTVLVEARDAAATTPQASGSQGYTVNTSGSGTVPTITNPGFNAGTLSPWTFHSAPGATGGNGYADAAQWCRGGAGSCANISCGSGGSGYHGYRQTLGPVTGGTQYTLRAYLKTQETTAARLRVYRADGTQIAEVTTGNTGGVWPSSATALSFTNPAGNTQLIIEHGVVCGGSSSEVAADDWSITSP